MASCPGLVAVKVFFTDKEGNVRVRSEDSVDRTSEINFLKYHKTRFEPPSLPQVASQPAWSANVGTNHRPFHLCLLYKFFNSWVVCQRLTPVVFSYSLLKFSKFKVGTAKLHCCLLQHHLEDSLVHYGFAFFFYSTAC